MKTRTIITTQGKSITFKLADKLYYTPSVSKAIIFDDNFKNYKYCVAYTKIKRDCGYRDVIRWGTPSLEYYDNGNIGYQCFNYFNDINEATKDFKGRKKLSPKSFTNTIGYGDVFLIENNN